MLLLEQRRARNARAGSFYALSVVRCGRVMMMQICVSIVCITICGVCACRCGVTGVRDEGTVLRTVYGTFYVRCKLEYSIDRTHR